LAELLVHEGDIVQEGDVIARLSDTKFKGAYGELDNQHNALKVKLLRLQSELDKNGVFEVPASLRTAAPDVSSSETGLFRARWNNFIETDSSNSNAVELRLEEEELLDKLVERNVVSDLELIKAKQKTSQASAEQLEYQNKYELQVADEYAAVQNEMKQLEQSMLIRQDQLRRTTILAPTRSIVNSVAVNTIGGVIAPGEEIIELIPLDDELKLESKIDPQDIAFIHPGMRATIKLTAYDYTVYGNLSGLVTHISADTFDDGPREDTPPYYKVIVEVDKESVSNAKGDIEIRPGMQAETELHVGNKTVLQYLLKPLFKTTESMREP